MIETDVSRKLREALVSVGAVAWKTSDRFHAARPDLLVWYDGRSFAIEVKIHPNKPTDLQAHVLQELQGAGVTCYVATYTKISKTLTLLDLKTSEPAVFKDIRSAVQWVLRHRY